MSAPPAHPRARVRAQARDRVRELEGLLRQARERLTTAMRCGPYAVEQECQALYDAIYDDLQRAKREARR